MKVIVCDEEDRSGACPILFPKSATMADIHEWLWMNYQGYKFGIVFDETKDEYESMTEARVYFLDGLKKEVDTYFDERK